MANEEIIQSWKQPSDDKSNAPANPAGDSLSDSDLDRVAGGVAPESMTTEGALTLGCCTLTEGPPYC